MINVAKSMLVKLKPRPNNASGMEEAADLARQAEIVAADFDPVFYALRYPEAKGDLLEHFMTIGWRDGNDPSPWFSTASYLETYPDVAAAGLNPFYHYVCHGREEDRITIPAAPTANDRMWEIEAIRQELDESYYRGQLQRLGIDPAPADLALHYWREGVGLGLDPAPEFSTTHYLQIHADVANAGVNPFAHFLVQGKTEGRSPRPVEVRHGDSKEELRSILENEFDPVYYLAAYSDVAAAGVDPLDHFLNSGWRERRNPNAWFSVADYLEAYPDIVEAGINPFLHYVLAGKTEGRSPRHELGFRYDIIKSLVPLEDRVKQIQQSCRQPVLSNRSVLRRSLRKLKRLQTGGLYLSISHDDFTENFGGVQLVLMRESAAVDEREIDHLHLFPATPLPVAEFDNPNPVLGMVLNRRRVGFFRAHDVASELAALSLGINGSCFAIHSLIGHNPAAVISILKATDCKSGWYWVHDYSSVCTGYTLLRNDVEFCGGPPSDSAACSICVYGPLRNKQIAAHKQLFERLKLTVVAPSEAALEVWKAALPVTATTKVHPHLRLTISSRRGGDAKSRKLGSEPLRVAYVGLPVPHKGWPAFRELAMRFGTDPRYEFHHVGKGPQPGVPAIFSEVAVGPDDLDKMVSALSGLKIDVAIFWSLWPETFCIAAVEALRAGAAVLTFRDSGNVAALVRQTGFGAVLDTEDELAKLFETGEVIQLAQARRPQGLSTTFSNMTADLIEDEIA